MSADVRLTVPGKKGDAARQPILIDSDKPQLAEVRIVSAGGGAIREGSPSTAEVSVEDTSGVERIEYGFDKNENGVGEEDELLPPYKPDVKTATGKIRIKLPTEELPVGTHDLVLRAVDKVGHVSPWYPRRLRIVPLPPPPPKPKGVIQGKVKYKSLAPKFLNRFRVTIEGTGLEQRTADDKFRFPDLDPKKYTLLAEGFFQGKTLVGKQENVEPSDPKKPKDVTINLEVRKKEDEDDGN
jgi:hypothetical protein